MDDGGLDRGGCGCGQTDSSVRVEVEGGWEGWIDHSVYIVLGNE